MNQAKLNELIKGKMITVPLYVLKMCRDFNLNTDEVLLLLYLYNQDGIVFNPKLIGEVINVDSMKVIENISKLVDKGLMNISSRDNNQGIREEVIDLEALFEKLTLKVMEELNKTGEEDINVYHILEEEFNRKLTPMECDMVDDWKKNGYSNELIKEATKEAVLNGVNALRYIDKILYEWNKKGFKKKEDLKNNKKEAKEQVEIYNCNWLDSDEEI